MVWVRDQLSRFLDRIEKQIFSPSTPLETIAVSVEGIRKQCGSLRDAGLDLLFLVDSHLRRNVERTVSRLFFSTMHSALKLEKSAISKVQKNIICIFKNGKKSIFAPTTKNAIFGLKKTRFLVVLNFLWCKN